jgi:hypothetical protein
VSGGAGLGAIGPNCCTASLVSSAAHSIAGVVTGTAALWRPPAAVSDLDQLNYYLTSFRSDVFPFEWLGIHIVPWTRFRPARFSKLTPAAALRHRSRSANVARRRYRPNPCGGMRMPRVKRTRRKHSVRASVQIHQLSKAGTSIDFHIYADEEKIGTMIIGRGSLTWFGRNRKTPIELNWTRFAQIMDERYDD